MSPFIYYLNRKEKQNELQGFKNGELLRVRSCKVYPKPYNFTEHMEYVMFNVDDREEIVIESETEIKSAVIRPLSAGISFEISFER